MSDKVVQLSVVSNDQESLSNQLMTSIRAEIMRKEYDRMHVSTLIGVLEMLKIEMYERTDP